MLPANCIFINGNLTKSLTKNLISHANNKQLLYLYDKVNKRNLLGEYAGLLKTAECDVAHINEYQQRHLKSIIEYATRCAPYFRAICKEYRLYNKSSKKYIGEHHSRLIFNKINSDNSMKWKKALTKSEIRIFTCLSRCLLRRYGYETKDINLVVKDYFKMTA